VSAGLDAFLRLRAEEPAARPGPLAGALSRLRRSADPVVAFGSLPRACVPEFADGCQVELTDGAEPLFRREAGSLSGSDGLETPVRGDSYAGLVTYWWAGRPPSGNDAAIAHLLVQHVIALVEHERLLAAVAQAEDRAASLALRAISGRTISLATGIVMHQHGLTADEAEDLLRRAAALTGGGLRQLAASVVHSGSLLVL
jgi:hypothetical protein